MSDLRIVKTLVQTKDAALIDLDEEVEGKKKSIEYIAAATRRCLGG